MARAGKESVSRSVRTFTSGGSNTTRLTRPGGIQKVHHGLQKIKASQDRVKAERTKLLQGLTPTGKRILEEISRRTDDIMYDTTAITDVNPDDYVDEDQLTAATMGVSDEEAVTFALRDLLDSRNHAYRKYKDTRTWGQRIHKMDERWRELQATLVDAYLVWKYDDDIPPEPPSVEASEYDFNIECIDFYTMQTTVDVRRSADQSVAEALVRGGFLGATPDRPSLAVSIPTLELLRDIRRVKASFSIEAFTKLICYRYFISYRRRWRKAISDAFDVYLAITEHIYTKIQSALGRDAPDWRVRHGCPPCSYQVEGEETPVYECMIVMDGNNSLKRVAPQNRKVGDARTFVSDYYIPPSYVDRFADEVKPRQSQHHVEVPLVQVDNEGDPTDGAPDSTCTTNWKAAASDEKKRMWAIFEETGVFAAACRHGFVLWLIDMIRSGELAKYPLAIVSKAIDVIQTSILLGFDIGCTFKITLANSSLGSAFDALHGRVCVNAFHGYSHAYPCQLRNHPNGIPGMGLEDLETLERVFSASNQLAPVIRYASSYRRVMLIHMFFRQWDDEKYNNLAQMLFNNYCQALDIIANKKSVVEESMKVLELTMDDLKRLEREEQQYFQTLRDESPWDLHAVAYVEALEDLRDAKDQLGTAQDKFLRAAPSDYRWQSPRSGPTDYNGDASATARLETRRRELARDVQRLESEAIALEVQLNLQRRWASSDKEYQETLKYIAERRYQKALGRLQRLVIQRLFELQKLNVSQTAYRMRTQIAKSLQKRCKAIHTAVTKYNEAAAALDPPRPKLDWDKVSHYDFLQEFTLLQDTRNDIRDKPWAQPLIRETMCTARRIERAEEELRHCNREARRLHTSICDEDALFTEVLEELREARDPIYGVVNDYVRRRRSTNAHNLAFLRRLYAIEGFTGDPTPGTYTGPPRESRPRRTVPQTEFGPLPDGDIEMPEVPEGHDPATLPLNVHPDPASATTVEALAQVEVESVVLDEHDSDADVDEDEDGMITDLVEHMSNIAVVM